MQVMSPKDVIEMSKPILSEENNLSSIQANTGNTIDP